MKAPARRLTRTALAVRPTLHLPRRHRPRRLPTSALKFVVFGIVCLVLMVGLAVKIGDLSLFASRASYSAELHDVTGLSAGDPVEIAGVRVGQVSSIAVQRAHALVGLALDPSVRLRASSDVGLRWRNVLGQKVVYLYPGKAGPLLAPGATVRLGHDVSDASVNALLNSLGPLLQAINPQEANAFVQNVSGALQGDTAEIDQLINNSATVARTVGSLNVQVGAIIDGLDRVLTAIAARSGDLQRLVGNLQSVAQSLASHNGLLEDVVTNLASVTGDLAQLIGTNRTNLDTSIGDLDSVMALLDQHQQELSQGLATLGEGLAPYTEISSWGQWFQIQPVYTCLANETSCSYYQSSNPPSGSGPGGGLPSSSPTPGGSAAPGGGANPFGGLPSATGSGPSSLSAIISAVGGGSAGGGKGTTP